jgi:FMN phosphatase YigB (HAD superfamily)
VSRTIRAVRIDIDGTLADLQLPVDDEGVQKALHEAIDGRFEIANYARPEGNRRLAVAADAEGRQRQEQNRYATSLINALYRQQLPRCLHGPVVLLGAMGESQHYTDVPEPLREVLPKVMAALETRYGAAT